MSPVDQLTAQTIRAGIPAKFAAMRSLLALHQLDAYLVPSADEHLNEYLPAAKQRRNWISGFTGSAGDLLLGREQTWLFVDSRYYEQAELEVDPTLVQVAKVGREGHKTLEGTLEVLGREALRADTNFRLGFDPFTLSVNQHRSLATRLSACGVVLVPLAENLVDRVRLQQPWVNAEVIPPYADSKLFYLPDALTGETIAQKLTRVRSEMQQANADILPLTKLDQIAWLYNLRGWDVPYNPVFIAYALVTAADAFLFTNLNRIDLDLQDFLQSQVTLHPYELYAETLRALVAQSPNCRVLIDPKHTTMGTQQILTDPTAPPCQVVEASNPVEALKARKNAIEIAQMEQANLKASRAKTRTLKWIDDQLTAGATLTEADVAATVEQFYAAEADFQGLSFNTIAGAGANSSIVHYGTPDPNRVLHPGELLLLDSGAQYASGTTDDTRTIVIGDPTPEQIACYTEVLKSHINCAMQRFPKGTTGAQLDGIARSTLWLSGLDYGHGTGHGVGAFLNVHEGPNGISKRVSEPLEPGMVTSVEPGFYQPGWGGIRIENLYVVQAATAVQTPMATSPSATDQTAWYEFTPLTYIPFDRRLIDHTRLDARQRTWLEHYYAAVMAKLAPLLDAADVAWLQQACQLPAS